MADLAPAGEWCWATQAAGALTAMQKLASEAIARGYDAVDPDALATQAHHYRSAALIGISQTRDRPGALARKHHALARRLLDRQDDYLRFTKDLAVAPDNNGCERDIRSLAAARNDGGSHRADWSAAAFARLKSVIVTGMKNRVRFIRYGIEVVRAQLRGERLPLPLAATPDTS